MARGGGRGPKTRDVKEVGGESPEETGRRKQHPHLLPHPAVDKNLSSLFIDQVRSVSITLHIWSRFSMGMQAMQVVTNQRKPTRVDNSLTLLVPIYKESFNEPPDLTV